MFRLRQLGVLSLQHYATGSKRFRKTHSVRALGNPLARGQGIRWAEELTPAGGDAEDGTLASVLDCLCGFVGCLQSVKDHGGGVQSLVARDDEAIGPEGSIVSLSTKCHIAIAVILDHDHVQRIAPPPGADVLYTYHLTNTGTTHLVNITLNDNRLGPIGPISNVLAPGASLALTATGLNTRLDSSTP